MNPQEHKCILTYHKVKDPGTFENHLKVIQGKTVLVTFDDGDRSVYENAFPLLKKYKIPAILFIVTDLIDSDKPFWWDEVVFHLGSVDGSAEVKKLKSVPNSQRLLRMEEIRQTSGKSPMSYPQLTRSELREMHDGGVTIANHSHTHPMFDQLTQEEKDIELEMSRNFFNDLGFGRYDWFAYPNGNYNEESERILKKHGISRAYLFDHKIAGRNTDSMRISRLSVNDHTPMWKYKLIISGLHSRLLPVTKKLHSLFS